MSGRQITTGIIVLLLIWLAVACTYSVGQYQRAILFRFGKIERTNMAPGLHFKLPFVEGAKTFDGRIQSLDTAPQQFLTANKRNVKVDYFVKWRIDDTVQYYKATGGQKEAAEDRLASIIRNELRNEFSSRSIQQAVSGQRTQIMQSLDKQANKEVQGLGIKVIDVRIKRIELPDVVSKSVYDRMRAEREQVAKHVRAEGKEQAEQIRANANRQRTVILAKAYAKAQKIRGGGDAKAARIYNSAYAKAPEFYRFYRSLQVYRNGWNSKQDMLVLEPDSALFKYFNSPGKKH